MSKEYKFLIYAIEAYKQKNNIPGDQVLALFKQTGVFDYVMHSYAALHVLGTQYLLNEFEEIIAQRQFALKKPQTAI
ncbi:protein DUF3791 [Candidatus Termititenax aidoneus]|uniref:Protein DUF3791 n=1 Tax=Termititenax aidoneus TaxID=2218524 RepID=A0A388TCZ4_TERA1|nr:protein DUF3791 [Candidatus Termititenax aidoneus]